MVNLKESSTLKVRLHQVRLNRDAKSIKVMVTGDWHISPIISENQANFLQEAVTQAEPDVILLQGDIVDSPTELERETSLKKVAKRTTDLLPGCANFFGARITRFHHS